MISGLLEDKNTYFWKIASPAAPEILSFLIVDSRFTQSKGHSKNSEKKFPRHLLHSSFDSLLVVWRIDCSNLVRVYSKLYDFFDGRRRW